jgi:hypothetical protein|tara:strand:- start:571 stop:876 length:306 start_codon:yes stop_codon:yes gene_type:complete
MYGFTPYAAAAFADAGEISVIVVITNAAAGTMGVPNGTTVSASANVYPIGVEGTAYIGSVLVWGGIPIDPNTVWTGVPTGTKAVWTEATAAPNTVWTRIAA